MAFTRVLTHNSKDDGQPIGLGIYYIDDNHIRQTKLRTAACVSTDLPNGGRRSVFVDRDGRAIATGWFKVWPPSNGHVCK
ncbi:hypothetical protein [Streptomyces sp. NRRL F-5123]|uniref:hypothetical protein n=1 Tax=Streptomyces sp. NRRL F-5123 TaxID=1463856 RepID=UPI0004E1CFE8|nr:hypothetical protein [Streptomyces sp. NRRL F-5123]